eukprot:jgi/Picsp_1/2305/NSC_05769-R1_histone deacetylase
MEFYAGDSQSEDFNVYALHDAVESGDIELVGELLYPSRAEQQQQQEGVVQGLDESEAREPGGMFVPINTDGQHMGDRTVLMSPEPPVDVNKRDNDQCTPLHLAILNGQAEIVEMLLERGARISQRCEGALPLHIAVCAASLTENEKFMVRIIKILVKNGCVVLDRDDHGRTPLHWAAHLGVTDEAEVLVELGKEMAAKSQNIHDMESEDPFEPVPTLWEFEDKQGNLAAHLAARYGYPAILQLLMDLNIECVKAKNKSGFSVAHMAAIGGNIECAALLVTMCPDCVDILDRQERTPGDVAEKRGFKAIADIFRNSKPSEAVVSPGNMLDAMNKKTLIVAPPECLNHHTAPWPIARDDVPPPENVKRLSVLTDPEVGCLKSEVFKNRLVWDERPKKAAIGDVLRVHDWSYVLKLQTACQSITSSILDVRHLDPDTAISHGTFKAAMAAAGAVCHAVDEVVQGRVKNAFCPVRPPGHHAGPHGVVTSTHDPNGSHGFCLLNNIAIGAAYAMSVHRHAGIHKVAILDFDVHHGNGTEACVANTAPSLDTFEFATPYGKGTQTFPIYKPWYDEHDKDAIFFASVQGYGPKGFGIGSFVYPGSGATCDTQQVRGENAGHIDEVNGVDRVEDPVIEIEEDPDGEFKYSGGDMPRTEGPRIIDVGIPGPGAHVPLWKRSWRDKIFPALVKFDPDIIFISAGFDAHKKDDINFAYIGIQEKDFEWITDQIVQVANKCCDGRVVSVLEGGYRIQGNIVSAFSRSVAAHVRAMAEPNHQEWDPLDAKWEREREKRLRAEAEARRQAEARAAEEQARLAQALAQEQSIEFTLDSETPEYIDNKPTSLKLKLAVEPEQEAEASGRSKRRRSEVNYVALNKKLEEEKAGKGTSS